MLLISSRSLVAAFRETLLQPMCHRVNVAIHGAFLSQNRDRGSVPLSVVPSTTSKYCSVVPSTTSRSMSYLLRQANAACRMLCDKAPRPAKRASRRPRSEPVRPCGVSVRWCGVTNKGSTVSGNRSGVMVRTGTLTGRPCRASVSGGAASPIEGETSWARRESPSGPAASPSASAHGQGRWRQRQGLRAHCHDLRCHPRGR